MNTTDAIGVSQFSPIDYSVFGTLLLCSTAIGLYFGFFGRGAQTTEEYLHGGHKMQTFPVAVSLITSMISAWTIVAVPSEVYSFGWLCAIPYPFTALLLMISANYLFLPVYHQSGIDNCYMYLELRFSRTMRCILTVAWMLHVMFYMPIVLYLPSLAFAEVTGHNVHAVNIIACYCCVIYTMLGGIKAVVWTDVVQGAVMLISILLVVLFGLREIGGFNLAWDRAVEGGRVFVPKFTENFTTRSTFWNMMLGPFVVWTSHLSFNQSCVQRLLSLPTLSQTRKSILIFSIGVVAVKAFSFFNGIIMYAYYYGCDPVQTQIVDKADKLVPRFVQDVVGHITGMPGVFISCVFSASLSTVSANLNTIAGVLYMDFIRPLHIVRHTDANANRLMKVIVFVMGSLCVLGVWVIQRIPSCFHALQIIDGMIIGSTFGVFSFGMLYPWANRHGALYGVFISMAVMCFIITNTQIATGNGLLKYESLPTSIENCDDGHLNSSFLLKFTNATETQTKSATDAGGFALYKIAFMWYCPLATLVMWASGIIISYFTGGQDLSQLDLNLLSPGIKYLLPAKYRHTPLQMEVIKSKTHDSGRDGFEGIEKS